MIYEVHSDGGNLRTNESNDLLLIFYEYKIYLLLNPIMKEKLQKKYKKYAFANIVPYFAKKVFTPQTFKNYFYKHFEMSKEMTKAFKDGKIKKGDIIVESLTCIGNEIKGQKFGDRKQPMISL